MKRIFFAGVLLAFSCAFAEEEKWSMVSESLEVAIAREGVALTVTDRRTQRRWETRTTRSAFSSEFSVSRASKIAGGFCFDLTHPKMSGTAVATFSLEKDVLHVTFEAPANFRSPGDKYHPAGSGFPFPQELALSESDCLIVPFSEGFRLPASEKHMWFWDPAVWTADLSMPFFGVEDGRDGSGWMAILLTPNDAYMSTVYSGKACLLAGVAPGWAPTRGRFGYCRQVDMIFIDQGGYVAMAKRYRAVARRQGLVKTFREKVKERPNVDRLLGAANVWYFPAKDEPSGAAVVRELQTNGIDRILWSSGKKDVDEVAKLPGVLVGRYDCYRDVYRPEQLKALGWPIPPPDDESTRNTSAWPDDIVWKKSDDPSSWAKAWGVRDKMGTMHHCAVQCPSCQIKRLRRNVSQDIKVGNHPYTARFLDVTTAIGWEECENPSHPMSRSQSRQAAVELLGCLGKEFGLVVGSEQGMDAAVPVCDYFEGMLSPRLVRMPHGGPGVEWTDSFRVREKVPAWMLSAVEKYDVGAKYRIPLFELVYHDCCCSHWYWFDYSNRPLRFWLRRDLLNALYGTSPMYIFDYRHWTEFKDLFVASYARVSPIARRTGYSEMIDHKALDSDRTVQSTTFSDGTIVTVNFGYKSWRMPNGDELGPLSMAVSSVGGQRQSCMECP